MKLEKISEELNMFEKKNILLKDFKQKLVDFKNINSKFMSWDYITNGEDIKDNSKNYLLIFLVVMLLCLPMFLLCSLSKMPWLNSMLLLATNIGITYYARDLKFGMFKNRYKKWRTMKNDINTTMNDNDSICSLLLEVELQLKSLKQSLNQKEELETILDDAIEKLVKDMKNIFATHEGRTEDIIQLLKNIEEIEKYETEIKNIIKNYQLNKNYYDYKKANGIIENKIENDSIEKTLIADFKSLL